MLKIDTHAHYLPRDWPDLATKYGDNRFPVIHHGDDGRHRIYKDGKFFREIWPKAWDPQLRSDDYAGFGVQVQVQVLSTVPVMFSEWAKPRHALELCPQLAIRELERCMDELGLQGVQERGMLGTDFPFPLGEQAPDDGIERLGLGDAQRARLCHGAALEWLGLPASRFA